MKKLKTDTHLLTGSTEAQFVEFLKKDFKDCRTLGVRSFLDSIIVPGPVGAIVDHGKYVVDSMSYSVRCPEKFRIVPCEDDVENRDEDVLFLGSFESCWGHCITDNLKHLWVLQSSEIERYRELKWVYALEVPGKGLPRNFIDILGALGISVENLLCIDRPMRFRTVFMPQPCFFCDAESSPQYRYYTKEFEDTIRVIVDKVDPGRRPNPSRKVYLTRTGWKKGNPDFGERHIEAAFAKKGFEVVHPENLNFSETVRLMGECHTLASTEGSTAHNSIFLPKESNLVVLRKADYINEYQPVINQMQDLNVTYIDAHKSVLLASKSCPFSGPFFLYCNKSLAEYMGAPVNFPIVDWFCYMMCWLNGKIQRFIKAMLRKVTTAFSRLFYEGR